MNFYRVKIELERCYLFDIGVDTDFDLTFFIWKIYRICMY